MTERQKKQFVNFCTAKILQDMGYDLECLAFYSIGSNRETLLESAKYMETGGSVPAPLYQEVFDWFFEVHDLHVHWNYSTTSKKDWVITINHVQQNDARDNEYATAQQAKDAAIIYAIKKINKK